MKNAIIFGDSYSTFQDYIPEGYAPYYVDGGNDNTDVTKVQETWWHLVSEEANLNIIRNDSWSGSPLSYTGWGGADCSKTSSFIYRFNKLMAEGFFEKNQIDTVFLFGATNDSAANSPLGELKYDDFKDEDLYCVLPAICYFVKKLKETLPSADVYCLVNTELKPQITDAFQKACEKFGVTNVTFKHIDKQNGHPTIKGMQDIKAEILKIIK